MEDYNKLKVAELRDVLKQRGIPSTGLSRKQQIVEALEAHDATQAEGQPDEAVSAAEPTVENGGAGEPIAEAEEAATEESGLDNAQVELDQAPKGLESANEDATGAVAGGVTMGEARDEDAQENTSKVATDPAALPAQEQPDTVAADSKATKPDDELAPSGVETPQETLSSLEEQSSESRKRKRRSPTPTPSEGSIKKKLKTAEEELVKLPEDDMMDEAPVTPGDEKNTEQDEKGDMIGTSTLDEIDSSAPPSTHPATRSLYIRDLLRPLQPQQLREHITALATRPGEELDDSVVTLFHLDNIRTHAFVSFASASAASRVRSALHGRIWPDESTRKNLWVDFVPDERVQEWIDRELDSGNNKRDVRRWEIEYTTLNDGTVTASLQEITAPTGPRRKSSFSSAPPTTGQGQGVMNAPLGPRADRQPGPTSQNLPSEPRRVISPTPVTTNNSTSSSFNVLDERFSSTTTKPKIYYLPVAASLAEKRLDTLDRETSRTWDKGKAMKRASGVEQQLRRYTFEDGERLVDGGVDGGYGYRGPGVGFGRRGGGGGYRGGRGRGFP